MSELFINLKRKGAISFETEYIRFQQQLFRMKHRLTQNRETFRSGHVETQKM